MDYCQTFTGILYPHTEVGYFINPSSGIGAIETRREDHIPEPIVQVVAEPNEPDYGWQSYVVLPR